ncbi:hypothetical protein [Streptomyces sp. NPDC001389]|uniref:hypothetical protein n=1 Tax=Streptomyces sp. NPDC001389 TaxID=3364569 RepID=UPI0036B356FA
MPYDALTDRDERTLPAVAEQRISEPLRIGAAPASARRLPARRSPVRRKARQSLACQQPNTPAPRPLAR